MACNQGFGGSFGVRTELSARNWGFSKGEAGGTNEQINRWRGKVGMIPAIHARLLDVVIEHQDALRCIGQWESKDTLLYVDPPYINTEGYKNNVDHAALAKALKQTKSRVVVSYFDHPQVRELYTGWRVKRIERISSMCGGKVSKEKRRRFELIVTNF